MSLAKTQRSLGILFRAICIFIAPLQVLTLFLCAQSRSENYYQHHSCPSGTQTKNTLVGEVAKNLLPKFVRNQGNTTTCSFHAAIAMLDSVRKFADPTATGDLSTADAVLKYGSCKTTRAGDASGDSSIDTLTNPAAFLIKLSSQSTLGVDEEKFTVKRADEGNQCLIAQTRACHEGKCGDPIFHEGCIQHACENSPHLKSLASSIQSWNEVSQEIQNEIHFPIKTLLKEKVKEKPIPEFSLMVKDFSAVDGVKERFDATREGLLRYFTHGNPPKNIFPVGLVTCHDDVAEKACTEAHTVALSKIEKVECLDASGKVVDSFHNASILNSWGRDSDKPLHLEKLIEGMARHRMGFVQIRSCPKDGNCKKSPIENEEDTNASPLHHYAEAGDLKNITRLARNFYFLGTLSEVINQTGMNGATALTMATANGHLDIVKELVQAKANVNLARPNGDTPLFIAAKNGNLEIVKELVRAKANPNMPLKSGSTPLFIAAKNGYLDIVKVLIQAKAHLDVPLKTGATALLVAAYSGHSDIVNELIHARADVEKALSVGIEGEAWEAVELLIHQLSNMKSGKYTYSPEQIANLKVALGVASQNKKSNIVNYLRSVGVK